MDPSHSGPPRSSLQTPTTNDPATLLSSSAFASASPSLATTADAITNKDTTNTTDTTDATVAGDQQQKHVSNNMNKDGSSSADTAAVAAAAAAADVAANDDNDLIHTAHLARFEFSHDGKTKILMVEWYPDAVPASTATDSADARQPIESNIGLGSGSGAVPASSSSFSSSSIDAWQVSWPGKSTTLPARDADDADGSRRRVYFLLPPDAPIPATITLSRHGRSNLELKPLPAIFPEGFAAEAGTRGVLHTIWARKRLSELDREMKAELRANAESVGLEMAMAEKQWIEDNFIRALPPAGAQQPPSPVAMRAIAGGANRLGGRLRGLKLATSPVDLVPSPTANTFTSAGSQSHTLSPQVADISVSSFSSISAPQHNTAPISLDAALKGDIPAFGSYGNDADSQDTEDDLFALPMSPRSPEMARSPFSILR